MHNNPIHKILLVDDDQDVLDVTCGLLSEQGYSVVPCLRADEALDNIRRNPFDAVLTDIKAHGTPLYMGKMF